MTAQALSQYGIALFGVAAIWLTQSPSAQLRRYACIFGLASQPFWFVSTWLAEQWGAFALSVLYTGVWGSGFHYHWLRGGQTGRGCE